MKYPSIRNVRKIIDSLPPTPAVKLQINKFGWYIVQAIPSPQTQHLQITLITHSTAAALTEYALRLQLHHYRNNTETFVASICDIDPKECLALLEQDNLYE